MQGGPVALAFVLLLVGAPAPTVEVLSPGAEPRRLLSYNQLHTHDTLVEATWQVGTLLISGMFQGEETYFPHVRTLWEVTSVTTEDKREPRFQAAAVLIGTQIVQDEDPDEGAEERVDPGYIPLFESTLRSMRGLRVQLSFDSSGYWHSLRWPEGLAPLPQRLMQQLSRVLTSQLLIPLPKVPIGIGATWRVLAPTHTGLVAATEVKTFTLDSIDHPWMKVSTKLSFAPSTTMWRVDRDISVKRVSGRGEGIAVSSLLELGPENADQSVTIEAVLESAYRPHPEHPEKEAPQNFFVYQAREGVRMPRQEELRPVR